MASYKLDEKFVIERETFRKDKSVLTFVHIFMVSES